MALPLAVFALVAMTALVAAEFAAAFLEQRLGRNTLHAVQALGAAEAGSASVVAGWEDHGLERLMPGDTAVLPTVRLAGGTAYSPKVSRLTGELFLVRVEGARLDASGGALARRELGLLVRRADSAAPGSPPVRPLANRSWTFPY